MPKLHEIKRARATLNVELRSAKDALRTKLEEMDVGSDTPADVIDMHGRVTDLEGKVNSHDQRIADLEAVEEDEGERAEDLVDVDRDFDARRKRNSDRAPGAGYGHNSGAKTAVTGSHGYGEPTRQQGLGFKAARFAVGQLVLRTEGRQAACEYVERVLGDSDVAKALNTSGVATGGALIPQRFSDDFIELLRAAAVVRQCEPTIIDMSGGNLTIPRLAGGATAGYQGELDDMASSQETFDDLQLNAKKLTALVPVSNDLLRRAAINLESLVRDDMTQTMARREDLAFLIGDGSGVSPIGLLNLCAAANKIIGTPFADNTNATILTNVVGVLQGMELTLRNNFSRMIRPRWITTPTTISFLKGLRDQVGNFVFKAELDLGTLNGIPFFITQQLPTNLTAATNVANVTANNGAYLFLADFADVILAETFRMVVDASDVASYKDTGGNMVSAFIRDQTAFRLIAEHDFNVRHQGSLAVAVLPAWAPAGWTAYGPGGAFYQQAPSGDGSAAPSTYGIPPTGSNNPANAAAAVPGGTLPGRP